MKERRRGLGLLLGGALLVVAGPAHAQPTAQEVPDAGKPAEQEVEAAAPEAQVAVDGEVAEVDPSEVRSLEETLNTRAQVQYETERYVESARTFKSLWKDYKNARYLYNIAAAHEVLRHDAYAYVYFRRYLVAPDRIAERSETALQRLNALRGRAGSLRLRFSPQTDLSKTRVTIHYRNFEGLADPTRPPLLLEALELERSERPGELLVYVELGRWDVTTETDGRKVRTSVEVSADASDPAVDIGALIAELPVAKPRQDRANAKFLNVKRPPDLLDRMIEARSNRRFSRVMGGVGLLTLAGGTTLLAYTVGRWNRRLSALILRTKTIEDRTFNEIGWDDSMSAMVHDWHLSSAGAGILGGGAGIGISGLLARDVRRPRVWATPIVLGTMMVAGGVAGLVYVDRRFAGVNARMSRATSWSDDQTARYRSYYEEEYVSAVLLSAGVGVGAGLIVGSLAGVVRAALRKGRAGRNTALGIHVDRFSAGLNVSGRF